MHVPTRDNLWTNQEVRPEKDQEVVPGRKGMGDHWWEKLSPCSIDGSSHMKKIPAEHIENLQKTPSSKIQD